MQVDTKRKRREEQKATATPDYTDSDNIYVGTRHSLHEDLDSYDPGTKQHAQPEKKLGFFGRLFGGNKEKEAKPEIKRVLPPFLRDDVNKPDDEE